MSYNKIPLANRLRYEHNVLKQWAASNAPGARKEEKIARQTLYCTFIGGIDEIVQALEAVKS